MNPKTLQYLMGHSDIGVTMNVYTHLGLEDAAAEMTRMEEVVYRLLLPIMGIGKVTAMVALTVIAMPAIMINTTAGFLSVEPMVLETARGMGMDAFQVFTRVEVPLAFPLILTGLRTSAVETIASATIASYIGAGGLGDFVYKGLGMNRTEIVLLGGVSIAVFSIVVDILLAIYQGYVGRYLE